MTPRRVLITGASRGIGEATALALAEQGAEIALLARSRQALERVRKAVEARGGRAVVLPVDVTEREALKDAVDAAVAALGGLDVVISNAGALVWGPFEDTRAEDFDRTLDVTFRAAVDLTRLTLPELEQSGGSLIYVGSIASQIPVAGFAAYAAAKHALRGFSNSLRIELDRAGSDVSVTYVKPGQVSTALWEHSTSATGEELRLPPFSYRVEEAVSAIVRSLEHSRPEVTVGGAARAQVLLFQLGRPLFELAMRQASRFSGTGRPARNPGLLWKSFDNTPLRGSSAHGRPSLVEAARRLADHTFPSR